MQSHLMMMAGVSFDLSWRRWNFFTFVPAITGIWEESLEEKVFEVVEGGCCLALVLTQTSPLNFPSGSLNCITCDRSILATVSCLRGQNVLPRGLMLGLLAVSAENWKAPGQKLAESVAKSLEIPGSSFALLLVVFSHVCVGLKQCPQLSICFSTFLSSRSALVNRSNLTQRADGEILVSGGADKNTIAVLGWLLRELSICFK